MCIEYQIQVNMYYVSAQGVDERMINVHDYYYDYDDYYYYYPVAVITFKTQGPTA